MRGTDWNSKGEVFSQIHDTSRLEVLSYIRCRLLEERPNSFMDYGAGDGDFVVMCADLPVSKIIAYDPTPAMADLATRACANLSNVEVVRSTEDLAPSNFDFVIFNAVWMCLPDEASCNSVLRDVNRLLKPGGSFIASVTHPCFRTSRFSTFSTNFDNHNYLKDGTSFEVRLWDEAHIITLVDTHWSIGAMSRQLNSTGFVISQIREFPDAGAAAGSPWIVIEALKSHRE